MHAKYEISISYRSKVKQRLKVDNTQTSKQNKNNMPQSFDPGHKTEECFLYIVSV